MSSRFNSFDASRLEGFTRSRLNARNFSPAAVLVVILEAGGHPQDYSLNRNIADTHLALWDAFRVDHPGVHVVITHMSFAPGSGPHSAIWNHLVPFPKHVLRAPDSHPPTDNETDLLYRRFIPRQKLMIERDIGPFIVDTDPWVRAFVERLGRPTVESHFIRTSTTSPTHWLKRIIEDWSE